MSKQKRPGKPKTKAFGTPYDDAFKTLLVDCPRLLIPVVNEVFGKSYTGSEQVILRANEHFLPGMSSENKKRITDSAFTIMGEKPESFLFECQSRPDNSMIVRMFEYATQEAIDTREIKGNTLYVTIPNAAVLFLRSTKSTPAVMKISLTTPGGSVSFDFHVMKIKDYSLKELFDKGLYFLLPFYIFVHETQFGVYNEDKEKRRQLTDEYVTFMEQLEQAVTDGRLSVYERGTILDMSRRVLEHIAAKYNTVRKGVGEIMGGKVLDYETKRAYNAGKADGKAEGKAEGLLEGQLESRRQTARKMHELGMEMKTITEVLGADERTIEEWLK